MEAILAAVVAIRAAASGQVRGRDIISRVMAFISAR